MDIETYNQKLREARIFYSGVGAVTCPVFDDELVHFNQRGFRHILRKGKIIRPLEDQMRRFYLLKHAPGIIHARNTIRAYSGPGKSPGVSFWKLTNFASNGLKIKVIVMKTANAGLQYLSVMDV